MFNTIKRRAKSNYYMEKLVLYRDDMKNTWTVLNDVIKRSKKTHSLPSNFIINDHLSSNNVEIAEGFNNYFVHIGKSTSDSMTTPSSSFRRHLTGHHPLNFFLGPVIPADLISTSQKLKSKCSEGQDHISTKLMKKSICEISVPLAHIFNLSFSTGIVPDQMKIAKVIPIFKNGNAQLVTNYRPISILPAFSKLLEKVVYTRAYNFINNNDIFYTHQYGFRKKHSTTHPVIQLIKAVVEANDKSTKDVTVATFLDLSKAFDTVSHEILLAKLSHYGIRGIANDWFRSYLTNRHQFTHLNGTSSMVREIVCGVPQGSILGPLLFLVYVNDIKSASNLTTFCFADDTTVLASGPDVVTLIGSVNSELHSLSVWLRENRLALNVGKTRCLIISPTGHGIDPDVSVTIDGQLVSRVSRSEVGENSTKFLGIHLDERLSWQNHIAEICKKLAKTLFAINMAKNSLPTVALITLYHALIESQIIYGIAVWGNSPGVGKIEKIQKQAMRIVYKMPYRAHSDPLFKASHILKVKDLYTLNVSLLGFDYKHNLLPKSFYNFYPSITRSMSTRQVNNIASKTPRTTFSASSIYHMIPRVWNDQSNNLKGEGIRSRFKNTCKDKFINCYSDIVHCDNPFCRQCA